MKKRYIFASAIAVIGAGLMVEMRVGSTSLDRVEIVESLVEAAGGDSAGTRARDRPANARAVAETQSTATAPADVVEVAMVSDEAPIIGSTGPSDEEMLLADSSPWSEPRGPAGSLAWGRVAGAAPGMTDGLDMVGQDSSSYALAGPINARRGGDALATALSQPVSFSPVPEPANWISMIVGLVMVGYAVRRRNRVRSVSS